MRSRLRLTLVALLVVIGAAAAVVAVRGDGAPARTTAARTPTAVTSTSASPEPDAGTPSPARADRVVGRRATRPVTLTIPAIGVRSRLERLATDPTGALTPPRHPQRAGWYAAGAAPGDLGPAVLAGHVDSLRGPAVFWRLASLQRGDRVAVTRADGQVVRFRVTDVRHVDRTQFPTQAVYGPVPDRALRLITCGGTYDHVRGRYRQNVVVFALAV